MIIVLYGNAHGSGRVKESSSVKTDKKCLLIVSAFSCESLTVHPLISSGDLCRKSHNNVKFLNTRKSTACQMFGRGNVQTHEMFMFF